MLIDHPVADITKGSQLPFPLSFAILLNTGPQTHDLRLTMYDLFIVLSLFSIVTSPFLNSSRTERDSRKHRQPLITQGP